MVRALVSAPYQSRLRASHDSGTSFKLSKFSATANLNSGTDTKFAFQALELSRAYRFIFLCLFLYRLLKDSRIPSDKGFRAF